MRKKFCRRNTLPISNNQAQHYLTSRQHCKDERRNHPASLECLGKGVQHRSGQQRHETRGPPPFSHTKETQMEQDVQRNLLRTHAEQFVLSSFKVLVGSMIGGNGQRQNEQLSGPVWCTDVCPYQSELKREVR